jgi:hypothetical protein
MMMLAGARNEMIEHSNDFGLNEVMLALSCPVCSDDLYIIAVPPPRF